MAGHTLLIQLDGSAPDFLGRLCSDDMFPRAVFKGGAVQLPVHTDRIVRPEDLQPSSSDGPADYNVGQSGVFCVREGFQIVVTSHQSEENYRSTLSLGLPLWDMHICMLDSEFV